MLNIHTGNSPFSASPCALAEGGSGDVALARSKKHKKNAPDPEAFY